MIDIIIDAMKNTIVFPVMCVCMLNVMFIYVIINSKKSIRNMVIDEKLFQVGCIILVTIIFIILLSKLNVFVFQSVYNNLVLELSCVLRGN